MEHVPLVKMTDICKNFGTVAALKDIRFEIQHGEVIGLVGDNGAGKSTLIRILTGIYPPTEGMLYFEGKKLKSLDPKKAIRLGIETVHQGFGLLPSMNITRNIFLGRESVKRIGPFRFLDFNNMEKESRILIQMAGIKAIADINSQVGMLSGGQQQAIKIGRTIYFKAKLVILDEPITGLSIRESDIVIKLVNELKTRGIAVIYITHRIDQVFQYCDRIDILEGGIKLAEFKRKDTTIRDVEEIIRRGEIVN